MAELHTDGVDLPRRRSVSATQRPVRSSRSARSETSRAKTSTGRTPSTRCTSTAATNSVCSWAVPGCWPGSLWNRVSTGSRRRGACTRSTPVPAATAGSSWCTATVVGCPRRSRSKTIAPGCRMRPRLPATASPTAVSIRIPRDPRVSRPSAPRREERNGVTCEERLPTRPRGARSRAMTTCSRACGATPSAVRSSTSSRAARIGSSCRRPRTPRKSRSSLREARVASVTTSTSPATSACRPPGHRSVRSSAARTAWTRP